MLTADVLIVAYFMVCDRDLVFFCLEFLAGEVSWIQVRQRVFSAKLRFLLFSKVGKSRFAPSAFPIAGDGFVLVPQDCLAWGYNVWYANNTNQEVFTNTAERFAITLLICFIPLTGTKKLSIVQYLYNE